MAGDIACAQYAAELARIKGGNLFVKSADAGALLVVEHRMIERAWNPVDGKFRLRAYVDNFVVLIDAIDGHNIFAFHGEPVCPVPCVAGKKSILASFKQSMFPQFICLRIAALAASTAMERISMAAITELACA